PPPRSLFRGRRMAAMTALADFPCPARAPGPGPGRAIGRLGGKTRQCAAVCGVSAALATASSVKHGRARARRRACSSAIHAAAKPEALGVEAEDQREEELVGASLRCRACGVRVAELRHHTGSSRHFNPHGFLFHIGAFSQACADLVGPATLADTWFPGYAWRLAACRGCEAHLGWRYESSGKAGFWGLIWTRLREDSGAGYPPVSFRAMELKQEVFKQRLFEMAKENEEKGEPQEKEPAPVATSGDAALELAMGASEGMLNDLLAALRKEQPSDPLSPEQAAAVHAKAEAAHAETEEAAEAKAKAP
ncbi:unnamed protein product, partial [Effrenium voratum]